MVSRPKRKNHPIFSPFINIGLNDGRNNKRTQNEGHFGSSIGLFNITYALGGGGMGRKRNEGGNSGYFCPEPCGSSSEKSRQ